MTKTIDALILGYPSMDRVINLSSTPSVGHTSLIENSANGDIYFGGCSLNIACILSNLNKKTAPVFRVGNDYQSIGLKAFLKDNHMHTEGIIEIQQDTTTNSYIIADENKNHITLVYPGAMAENYFQEIPDELFRKTKLAVMTVAPYKDNVYFLKKCKEYDVPVVFGMKTDKEAFPDELLKEILLQSSIIFCNESERKEIEAVLQFQSAQDLFQMGNAQILITTMGEDGSVCEFIKENVYHKCTIPVLPCSVVDTTGVGDAYIAGFLYGFLSDMSIEQSCYYGAACSACVIESSGSLGNIPSFETIETKLKSINLKEIN